MRFRALFVAVALSATAVWAWQLEDEFELDQVGARPGGGMNFGTGSKQDSRVTCLMCHVLPDAGFPTRISINVGFNPGLSVAPDGGRAYAPNQNYAVTVDLLNEHLGFLPDGGFRGHNNMAATFENAAGQPVGRLISDTGYSKGGNCPPTLTQAIFNAYQLGQTTVTFHGCNSIVGRARGTAPIATHLTQWKFNWVAPDAGTTYMYWGVTDGSGEEKTTGDDTIQGVLVLEKL